MSSLLAKCQQPNAEGRIQHVTPENADWRFVGFDVYRLEAGQSLQLESGDKELCLVLVAGIASVATLAAEYPSIGKRMSPFERTPPYAVYVPHHDRIEVRAESALELAVCSAPGHGHLPSRLITPADVGVERRGKGRNQRLVHNILPDSAPATACWWWKCTRMRAIPALTLATNTIRKIRRMNLSGRDLLSPDPAGTGLLHATGLYRRQVAGRVHGGL
jgi:5-deoxy-D-glucuronate isomerase